MREGVIPSAYDQPKEALILSGVPDIDVHLKIRRPELQVQSEFHRKFPDGETPCSSSRNSTPSVSASESFQDLTKLIKEVQVKQANDRVILENTLVTVKNQQSSLDSLLAHQKSLQEDFNKFKIDIKAELQSSITTISSIIQNIQVDHICDRAAPQDANGAPISTRMKYMEGIIKQASDWQYWDILDRQKLNPEMKQKKKNILTLNQNLTRQLIELERNFNALEFCKFGDTTRGPDGDIAVHDVFGPSRKMLTLQSLYNTLSSQLAAAEQLADCLSKQMAALNINPAQGNCQTIAKEIPDSIGFSHDSDAVQTPIIKYPCFTPSSAKCSEPDTARRRGDSLVQRLVNFEPQKTTLKRTLHGHDSRVKTFHLNSQKSAIDEQKNTGNHERFSKQDSRTQSSSLFKLTKMSSSQLLAPELESLQGTQYITQPLQSSFGISQKNSSIGFDLSMMPYAPATLAKLNSDACTVKTPPSPKPVSILQLDASTTLRSNDTVTPKILSASNAVHTKAQAGCYHRRDEDSLAGLSPRSSNLLAKSSSDFNPLSQSLHITIPSNCVKGTSGHIDMVTKGMSAETSPDYQATIPPSGASYMSAPSLDAAASSTTPLEPLSIPSTNSTAMSFRKSSFGTDPIGETSKIISSPSVLVVSSTSSVLPLFPSQKSPDLQILPSESATSQLSPSRTADEISTSVLVPSPSHSNGNVHSPSRNGSKAEHVAIGTSGSEISHTSTLENIPIALSNSSSNLLLNASSLLRKPSFPSSNLSSTSVLKDEDLNIGSSQEEDMEEEVSDTCTMLNLGSLSELGFGPSPSADIQNPNPSYGSFGMASGAPGSSLTYTSSSQEVYRPPSFSLPAVQPTQPSQSAGSGPFFGGSSTCFSGFGQPAQIGVGQHVLGSVLGSFGQSRQLGVCAPSIGSASAGNPIPTGFATGVNSGGFSSTAFSRPGGFVSHTSSSVGFAAAPTVGFAAYASNSSGFAGAATGGGFAAIASGSGGSGFARAASPGSGFGVVGPGIGFQQGAGAGAGGHASFGHNQGGFASMRGASRDPGRPPADLITMMRK